MKPPFAISSFNILLVAFVYLTNLISICSGTEPIQSDKNGAKHYCGSSLSDALFRVCRRSGFAPDYTPKPGSHQRTSGIIEECCHNPCTRSQLRQYCQKKQNHRTHPIKQQQHSDSSTTGPRDQREFRNNQEKRNRQTAKKKRNSINNGGPSNHPGNNKKGSRRRCTCENRSPNKNKQQSGKNQKRTTLKTTRHPKFMIDPKTTPVSIVQPEAQYVDDWDGEPLYPVQNSENPSK